MINHLNKKSLKVNLYIYPNLLICVLFSFDITIVLYISTKRLCLSKSKGCWFNQSDSGNGWLHHRYIHSMGFFISIRLFYEISRFFWNSNIFNWFVDNFSRSTIAKQFWRISLENPQVFMILANSLF